MDVVSEVLDAGPARALAGLLGGDEPDLSAGLPPLWHWVYLLLQTSFRDDQGRVTATGTSERV